MSRQIKDIKDFNTGLLVYPRTHISAVAVSSNTTLEDSLEMSERVNKIIKSDGDGNSYLANDGTYKVPQIIVNSEEELNALNVPEGTEAIVIYPEATYTKEEVNNSELIQSMVSHITIDGFDTSKVLTNTYTSSGSFGVPCRSSKGINYNKIFISYNELGITTIFLNEAFGADLIIYGSNTWHKTASDVYDFEMDYLTTLSEEQLVIFLDVIGSEYKYKSFSHAIKYVYCNLEWTYSKLVFNNNSMCNISEFIPYYTSIFGKPNTGEVIHVGSGILLGASLIDGYYRSFNGETIEKYEAYNTGNWFSLNPIESYRILTEKDVNVSIPTLTDGKVPIEQLPLTTTGDGTQFLSDNGNYKELNIPTKVSLLENDVPYASKADIDTVIDKIDGYNNGIYIASNDGSLIAPEKWNASNNNNAVGVAIISTNTSFIISRVSLHKTSIAWSDNTSKDVSDVPTFTDSAFTLYYDGESYTNAMYSVYNSTSYAAGYAKSKTIVFGENTLTGYIGSTGEWLFIIDNIQDIVNAFNVIGDTFDTTYRYYWTSCEHNGSNAWNANFFNTGDCYISRDTKTNNGLYYSVAPFYPLILKDSLEERVSELESSKQDKNLYFNNITASNWASDSTYSDFEYKCDISCEGVTADMYAEVVFAPSQATSGNYAPVCETFTDKVCIYSKVNTSITIPTILIEK